jgi:hypothetical protein
LVSSDTRIPPPGKNKFSIYNIITAPALQAAAFYPWILVEHPQKRKRCFVQIGIYRFAINSVASRESPVARIVLLNLGAGF